MVVVEEAMKAESPALSLSHVLWPPWEVSSSVTTSESQVCKFKHTFSSFLEVDILVM